MKRYKITLFKHYSNVRLYTVHYDGNNANETDSFIARFSEDSTYAKDFNKIIYWIDKMGKNGALERYFRNEDYAVALPVETSKLRLYCYRISENIIVLGNGGIKTSKKAKDSSDCYPHFKLMNHVAKKVYWALKEQKLELVNDKLVGKLTFNYPDNE